jgi:cell division protein FtsB
MKKIMQKINIRKFYYHVRHRYFTMNNVVIGIALIIGASWAWGSIGMMQRNYDLQKGVDGKAREALLAELEVQNLKFEQKYYQSEEYKELAVRERLGLVAPGEKVLFLPANSQAAKDADARLTAKKQAVSTEPVGNLQQWLNFLFGGNRKSTDP